MPIDYRTYHKDWLSVIRPAIMKRAKNCCEMCGVHHKDYGYRSKDGTFYNADTILKALDDEGYDYFAEELSNCKGDDKPIRIILTIAHLDHDIKNNDYSNLKALCQRCHNRYDMPNRVANRNAKKGQIDLF